MDIQTAIYHLEREWERVPGTFFGDLELHLHFNSEAFNRLRSILDTVDTSSAGLFDRRFVELTWFIPTFIRWQLVWDISEHDKAAFIEAMAYVEERLTVILGQP
jgi:hypothetical protein